MCFCCHEYFASDRGKCNIKSGKNHEVFSIVRESDRMYTIEASLGVAFVGNFPHAGVNNFQGKQKECDLMQNLFPRFQQWMNDGHSKKLERVVDVLCTTSGLNEICRFHCQTKQKNGKIMIPHDKIGGTDLE